MLSYYTIYREIIFIRNLEKSVEFCKFYHSYYWQYILSEILFFSRDHENEKLWGYWCSHDIYFVLQTRIAGVISCQINDKIFHHLLYRSQTLSVHIFIFTGRDLGNEIYAYCIHYRSRTVISPRQRLLLYIVINIVRVVLLCEIAWHLLLRFQVVENFDTYRRYLINWGVDWINERGTMFILCISHIHVDNFYQIYNFYLKDMQLCVYHIW